jgi:hypothetical protein
MGLDGCPTPRHTSRLTVGRNFISTLISQLSRVEVYSVTSSFTLRFVRGDEKKIQWNPEPGVGVPYVPGKYKCV